MDNRKGVAIVLAMFAALLVMFAGKACTDNINKKNNKKTAVSTNSTINNTVQNNTLNKNSHIKDYTITNNDSPTTDNIEYITDILGRVIGTVEPSSTEPTEETAEPQVEYVTDILGRVVSVIEPETVTTTEDSAATTEYKNPLEEYREQHPLPTSPGNNKDNDDERYTVPSSLYITIG